MAFFKEEFMNEIRTFVSDSITGARYKISDVVYDGAIKSNSVVDDAIVIIFECSDIPSGEQIISEVYLCDSEGIVIASKTEFTTITLNQGVLYKIRLPIEEV